MWGHINLHTKHWIGLCQTGLLWSRPGGAKSRNASPNCQVRSVLFWVLTQQRAVIPYWCSRTTYQSHLQGSRNPNERTLHDCSWLTHLSWGFCPSPDILKKHNISEASCVSVQPGNEAPGWHSRLSYSQSWGTIEQ